MATRTKLLQPGKRRRDEARGRIRALLAMESHVVDGVDVSEADIDRVENAIRAGKVRADVFPRLANLDTQISGAGAAVSVRFTKKAGEGAPIRFIAADDPTEAAAVREVDLQKRFHLSATELARRPNLTTNKSYAFSGKKEILAAPLKSSSPASTTNTYFRAAGAPDEYFF